MLCMVYPTPKSVPPSAVCVHVCSFSMHWTENRSNGRIKNNEIIRNMYKTTSAELPVACWVYAVYVYVRAYKIRSPPKCSFFTLAFYPNFVLCTIIHIFFSFFISFVLVLRRTHGPSISTHTHTFTSCHCVRAMCVCCVLTQVVYYIIVRVFKLEIVKRTPSPNHFFVLWMPVPVHYTMVHSAVCIAWRRLSKRMCAFTHANVHNNQWKL